MTDRLVIKFDLIFLRKNNRTALIANTVDSAFASVSSMAIYGGPYCEGQIFIRCEKPFRKNRKRVKLGHIFVLYLKFPYTFTLLSNEQGFFKVI